MSETIYIELGDAESQGAYRIAGQPVLARPSIQYLESFREEDGPSTRWFSVDPEVEVSSASSETGSGRSVRSVSGFVAGRDRRVRCRVLRGRRGYGLEIEGIGDFRIVRGVAEEVLVTADLEVSDLVLTALLGPPLALAFGWRDVWVLHASAVAREGRVRAFLGPGGIGKSTLAEYLSSRPDDGWIRVTDDLLPVRLGEGGLEALPRYPQPRWGPAGQRGGLLPEALPVEALYRLGRTNSPAGRPGCVSLPGRRAAAAALHQTVSAALFDELLLERHLEFCGRLAETVPVFALDYPLDRALLPAVEELLLGPVPEEPETEESVPEERAEVESRSEAETEV